MEKSALEFVQELGFTVRDLEAESKKIFAKRNLTDSEGFLALVLFMVMTYKHAGYSKEKLLELVGESFDGINFEKPLDAVRFV